MADTTFYNRGDAYHDSAGNPAIIKRGNELTFTEHFNAGGGGTLEPATAETLGGVKVGNGLNVTSAGTLSVAGVDYSTTEHLTGRKWIDGKDIFEKTVSLGLTSISDKSFDVNVDYTDIETLTDAVLVYETISTYGKLAVSAWVNSTIGKFTIKANTTASDVTHSYLTIQYTKSTPAEPETNANTRTVKKAVKKG